MLFFGRKKHRQKVAEKDRIISDLQKDYRSELTAIDEATHETEALNKKLESKGDTAYFIFLASGGEKRSGKR